MPTYTKKQTNEVNNETPTIFPFKRALFQGMKGREVEVLQDWLNELNEYYNFHPGFHINATGKYGLFTKTFVMKFQRFVGLEANGVFCYRTYDLMQWRFYNMIQSMNKAIKARGVWNN